MLDFGDSIWLKRWYASRGTKFIKTSYAKDHYFQKYGGLRHEFMTSLGSVPKKIVTKKFFLHEMKASAMLIKLYKGNIQKK